MRSQFTLANMHLTYDAKAKLAFSIFTALIFLALAFIGVSLGKSAIQKRQELKQVQALINNSGQVNNDLSSSNESKLFDGKNLADIQSRLQGRIKQIGDRYKIAIDSIQVLDPSRDGNMLISGMRLNGSIPEENLAPFILDLANSSPPIFLSDMDLRPVPVRVARVSQSENVIPKLSIQLVFSGLSNYNSDFNLR